MARAQLKVRVQSVSHLFSPFQRPSPASSLAKLSWCQLGSSMLPSNVCGQENHIITVDFLFSNFPITSYWLGPRVFRKWFRLHLSLFPSGSLIATLLHSKVIASVSLGFAYPLDPDCNFKAYYLVQEYPRICFVSTLNLTHGCYLTLHPIQVT